MSYNTLAAILSVIYGFAGMIFVVQWTTKARKPLIHVAGCAVFWFVAAALALSTSGLTSLAWTVFGTAFAIATEGDLLAAPLATWGHLCEKITDHPRVFDTRWYEFFYQASVRLRGCEPRLSGRSLVGWCVRNAVTVWVNSPLRRPLRR
jgi:hypothetical protein